LTIDNKKLLVILTSGIAILVFLTVILILRNVGGPDTGQRVALEFWGVFDDRTDFDKVIREFQTQNPNVAVVYRQFSFDDYEKEVINALAGGTGPDVFMIHHTWLAKHKDKLAPLPASIPGLDQPPMTFGEFRDQFVEVAVQDLTADNQVYAMPLYVDTLAHY
jgi:ABC-type glycerol-3-phosphate transport system substrate-binding protein